MRRLPALAPVLLVMVAAIILAAALAWLLPVAGNATAQAQAHPEPATPAALTEATTTGQDAIWSGIVLARNVSSPTPPPPELREFSGRLKRVFGYNQFELLGSAMKPISDRTERWLVPNPNFWMGVKARRSISKEARGGYLLSLQLFQDKRPLVDTEAKLAPGSPLFIRGPMYGNGQLIIVLQIQGGTPVVAGK